MKPIVKTNDARWKSAAWIIERFPENYREMTYLEPFLGDGSVFVNKDPSIEEVLNDPDCALIDLWRAIRDECGFLISKIKRTKHNEAVFKRHLASTPENDYMSVAVREFVLRHMSKSGMKNSFVPKEGKQNAFQKSLLEIIGLVNERVKSSFLLCREVPEVLKAFNDAKTFVYCSLPDIGDGAENQEKNMEIGDILKDYRGKVLVIGHNCTLHKRIYSGWARRSLPGNPKYSAWVNF